MISINSNYRPTNWEKYIAAGVAVFVVGLISVLVIRDRPFSDPNFPIFIRILLSVACAVLGAVIPGFLNIDLKAKRILIRAGGALALFVITFFFTPTIAKSPAPPIPKDGSFDIQGQVINADSGTPIIGASIGIESILGLGKRSNVISGELGDFQVNVNRNDILVIEKGGYQAKEITIDDKRTIIIQLKPSPVK